MITDKTAILDLVNGLKFYNIKHAIICPGSRNAPIINELIRHPEIKTYSIVDERSAGFIAIGISKIIHAPVAIVCTSGTAALNFAPAVAEAYYQRVPLLVLTADRPHEWINQGDSQSIVQKNLYGENIQASFELLQNIHDATSRAHNKRIISEAINSLTHPDNGPVHINIPLQEPLYQEGESADDNIEFLTYHNTETSLPENVWDSTINALNSTKKVMVVVGMNDAVELREKLERFAESFDAVVLHESTSNVDSKKLFGCIDRLVAHIDDVHIPELLITMGGPLISRKIKMILREKDIKHWHVDIHKWISDDYLNQTESFKVKGSTFLDQLCQHNPSTKKEGFRSIWEEHDLAVQRKHKDYVQNIPFSDLKVMEVILHHLPEDAILHLGNSTVVRYAQLFEDGRHIKHLSNRGTSGIEGSVSTAIGASIVSEQLQICVVGDLSFMYDINALWNNYIGNNVRIIVINNGGGGIFRFIEGPDKIVENEKYIETTHQRNVKHLAEHFNVAYESCNDLATLSAVLPKFMTASAKKSTILEINTPREINATILKNYFNALKP